LLSSSYYLSLLPLPPTHCLSPSFLSILLTTPPSFLSIHFLITYIPPSSREEEEGGREGVRRTERKEGDRE
jgi:hypothetical protein